MHTTRWPRTFSRKMYSGIFFFFLRYARRCGYTIRVSSAS